MAKEGFNTSNLHSDRKDNPEHGVLHKAIHPSVAYGYEDARHLAEVFQGKRAGYNYGRQLNPTVTALQNRLTKMEDGVASIGFATGMAAIASTMLSLLKKGDHIVSSTFLFGNTNSFFNTLVRLGIEVTFVDATEVGLIENALQKNTRLVFVETIANPVTQVADLKNIGDLCQIKNLIYCVDNTMTSPHLFSPKKVGASLIVNSLTKYIGGHGNALGGMITDTGLYDWSSFDNIHDTYRKEKAELWGVAQIKKKGLRDIGASMSPESAHHLAVGSETLPMRLDRACANAIILAEFCENQANVKHTYYPGLPSHPQHARANLLFANFGAIFSIDLADDLDCFDVLNNMNIVIASSNLGDTRTLAIPVAHTIYYEMGAERRASMGIADSMIRFSVGVEDIEDLLDDFRKALA
ncbi:MAG TPA: cystathionine gamma-synthase family protein [Gammaproteobacteria bacterium]|nr:cystathionine gamma-synthase family protein [Pseudomonadales bacterium]MEC7767273.1 cystathionine gamma-synthase family protein [Pseudomonadota bacterium]HBX98927.1 cystathionine gamma-synthase family protein [Gammaproteobacteria bacterium]MEC8951220.1 cystathionine gamma-synthase family protein [Pseudomonadota bacterium]MEC8994526.1 cystathionine gamma-synthase family protein [Pseudomonadota bacterium]|tara:strand:- start:2249 stop:3478 length:1230 start_codon:yes stop_codon:yes gene_type:complete